MKVGILQLKKKLLKVVGITPPNLKKLIPNVKSKIAYFLIFKKFRDI